MDLRTMLNDGSGPVAQNHAAAPPQPPPAAASASSPPRPPPQQPRPTSQHRSQHSQPPPQQHPLPSTPIQNGPPPPFDYPQSIQPSPARSASRDYQPAQQTPFTSPPPHGVGIPYAAPGRPQPPPLQQLSNPHDMRSPSSSSVPLQSPYARTPVASMRADNTAYPFPSHPHPDLASPVQSNRYPSSASYPPRDPRDSYSQPSGSMASPSATGHPNYYPGPSPMPQTPPVGTPGAAHPHLINHQHGRSGSAQSYHAYPPSQQFASPIATNHPLPSSEHMRPPSQPPTPHGPPLSAGSRQSVGTGVFAQPSSPYQQRASSSGLPYSPFPQQQQQQQQQQQPSPHVAHQPQPSPQAAFQRAQSAYDQLPAQHHHNQQHAADPHRASLSQSDRERSVSVSPKTRVPSLPSSAGHHSQASLSAPSGPSTDFASRPSAPSNPAQSRDAQVKSDHEAPPLTATRAERASTPAKRKMDDRDIKEEDLEQQEPRPPPFANGSHRPGSSGRPAAAHHAEPTMSTRRRSRHTRAPVWAQLYDRQQLKNGNYYLRKPTINHSYVNGSTQPTNAVARPDRAGSRHVSPEASRANVQGSVATQASPAPAHSLKPQLLGPWEPTIANVTPFNDVVQSVADFLFLNVVHPSELTSLHGTPGVHFEIEAKLGYLATGHGGERFRFQPPLLAEAVLDPHANYIPNFVSDMDESKHKFFNEHLNALVKLSSPQNPNNKNAVEPRVPINYIHTKEIDRFIELKDPRQALPPCLLRLIEDKRARMPSIRVTRDKNNQIIAKIIKVKVDDLHIHMPKALLDCRITVNVEVDYHGPLDGLDGGVSQPDRSDRHKDRLSYRQGLYQIDLTQVSQPEAGSGTQHKKHELEIELNTESVFEHGRRAAQDAPNNYDFLVEGFVNNIRYLARKITTVGPSR